MLDANGIPSRTTDGGATWVTATGPGTGWLQDTVFLDQSTGWAVGDGGGTYVTTDGGQTWNTRHSGTDEFIIGVDFVDERTGWAVGSGELPADFGKRLVRMKQASGLTWFEFSEALGVELKQVLRWRKGTEPCGGAYHSLVRLAAWIPGGLDILMGEDFLAPIRKERRNATQAHTTQKS